MAKILSVRLSDDDEERFERAAKAAGKTISEWLRDAGRKLIEIPRVDYGPMTPGKHEESVPAPHPVGVLQMAAEAEAPNGKSITDFLMGHAAKIAPSSLESSSDDLGENVATKPWLPELIRLQKLGEMDPSSSTDEFNTLLRGEAFRPPKDWANWSLQARAKWLDANRPLEVETESEPQWA